MLAFFVPNFNSKSDLLRKRERQSYKTDPDDEVGCSRDPGSQESAALSCPFGRDDTSFGPANDARNHQQYSVLYLLLILSAWVGFYRPGRSLCAEGFVYEGPLSRAPASLRRMGLSLMLAPGEHKILAKMMSRGML